MATTQGWRQLDIAIIGGGIGGQASATSLRRQGHKVTIYERADFAGEVVLPSQDWKVNIELGDPVILKKLISRDWKTGEPVSVYDLADYKDDVYMFHRQYMHTMLMDSALSESGDGIPAKLIVNHKAKHDVVIGADGIGSAVRKSLGIEVSRTPATCTCLHANVDTEEAVKLGLIDYSQNSAIEYWGGYHTHYKIVLSPCNGGKLLSYYCFFPREAGDVRAQKWDEASTVEELLAPYPDLDRNGTSRLFQPPVGKVMSDIALEKFLKIRQRWDPKELFPNYKKIIATHQKVNNSVVKAKM
ncbi:unnamed protein product [Clonostachys rosea f. rosea IK726]|uniref:Uncharacterized protein n=1 Tax=Clonostachys rosea f. rosea IK726 TaxID=1349383 RepID=A0ACA9UQ84_BIOOC|nr:unnamed protein product [Clonostachys rosea f. rosea IK726]